MKLLEMRNLKDNKPAYMIKVETDSEEAAYDLMVLGKVDTTTWSAMIWVIGTIDVNKDDDIIFYFMPSDQEPKVGETFELDDMVYERVA